MSIGGLEHLLYDLGSSGRTRQAFGSEPEAFLSRYRLDEEERKMVLEEDVAALFERGLNPMLLMGFYMGLHGAASLGDYLKKMPTLESRLAREAGQ